MDTQILSDLQNLDEDDLANEQQQFQLLKQQQDEQMKQIKQKNQLMTIIDTQTLKWFSYLAQFFKKAVGFVNLTANQTIKGIKTFLSPIYGTKFIMTGGTNIQILLANGETQDTGDFLPRVAPHSMLQLIIEPNDDIRNQGIRIMKNKANWDSFVLTGCNADPTNKDGVWKMGSTSSQFRIQKQEDEAYDYKGLIIDFDCTTLKFNNQIVSHIPIPPIEYAIYQSIAYGMYEQLIWGTVKSQKERVYISLQITHSNPNTQSQSGYTLFSIVNNDIRPKFSGTTHNIPLNAVLFAQKVYGYPIDWTGAIAMDCFINPQGNVIINTQCQISLPNDFCVQVCDSYAVQYQSA